MSDNKHLGTKLLLEIISMTKVEILKSLLKICKMNNELHSDIAYKLFEGMHSGLYFEECIDISLLREEYYNDVFLIILHGQV